MKKQMSLHWAVVLLFSLALFTGCTEDETNLETEATRSSDMVRPYGLISPDRMVELNQNWNTTRAQAIQGKLGIEDNQSVQFSLEELRNFLNYAEKEAQELGYEMDGVRIYFAAYSMSEPGDKAGLATAFFAPTGVSLNDTEGKKKGDIPGARGLNIGGQGNPPGADYPQ
ncbi:MAG: hypothetical protein ACWA5P_11345 [bacterium]